MPTIPGIIQSNCQNDSQGEIEKSKLLLVEGRDEVIFFEHLFKKNESLKGKFDEVQIIEIGGVDNFKNELPALMNRTGFADTVNSLAIVRDADKNFDSAFQSVCNILSRNDLCPPSNPNTFSEQEGPIKVGVFIMPGDSETGTMLEDLCLTTQADHPAMEYVNSFFESLEAAGIEKQRNLSKAKVQVFLAAMPKIVNSLGLGAAKGYWDLNHDSLTGLNNFLIEL
ncbi:hypothetical protein PDJ82_00155 [Bacillus cereus group sp. TH43LC]|uniref:DUF3226 domain-containing protein n=1 Tax=Bacillus cereus group TaxID=86661 RepID=UPI00077882BB|nr:MULTISPECIES: DUF3226 domain-containing protein [Bacillus cereus group]KXY01636.1 hypothetical protein AT271_15250 [Bacillus cereus]MBE7145097.1 hypothetical protein [Bacillus paranthracis]MCC2437809.1 hypothetical protein [Bacillus paranthracis]MDA1500020.1 hypothetical protein [Bacillus cereus group sp. TH43LC]MDA1786985.1 hypothetical protein [Bacillus cereus group sp. BY5-1LC]